MLTSQNIMLKMFEFKAKQIEELKEKIIKGIVSKLKKRRRIIKNRSQKMILQKEIWREK